MSVRGQVAISSTPTRLVPPHMVKSWRGVVIINQNSEIIRVDQGTDEVWVPQNTAVLVHNAHAESITANADSDVTLYLIWYAPGEPLVAITALG